MPETRRQPRCLIVEDAADTRTVLRALATRRGFAVAEAEDGLVGLEKARTHNPDLILLDIRMPNMDGLSALAEIREHDPAVPVIIISSMSDREYVEEALALGAVNFVNKPFNHEEIEFVLDRIYRAIEEEAEVQDVLGIIARRTTEIEMPGAPGYMSKVVSFLAREIVFNYPGFEIPVTEIKLALYEALNNALEHGNLEITFDEKSEAMEQPGGIDALIKDRLADPRYAGRQIHVRACYEAEACVYHIRDDGPGFDYKAASAKPVIETSALHGRGITLIRHYMADVEWNEAGNEIRMATHLSHRPVSSMASTRA